MPTSNNNLIELAYNYLLLYSAEVAVTDCVKYEGYNDVRDILITYNKNDKYNIDKTKLDLLVFLVTVGNGHKSELLKFWKGFKINEDDKITSIDGTNCKYYSPIKGNSFVISSNMVSPQSAANSKFIIDDNFINGLNGIKSFKIETKLNGTNAEYIYDEDNARNKKIIDILLKLNSQDGSVYHINDYILNVLKTYISYISASINFIYARRIPLKLYGKGVINETSYEINKRLTAEGPIDSVDSYDSSDPDKLSELNNLILAINWAFQPNPNNLFALNYIKNKQGYNNTLKEELDLEAVI